MPRYPSLLLNFRVMRNPIALLVNDLHISKDNIAEFNANWDEMISVCDDYDVSDVVIGGDIFTASASQRLPVLLAVKHAIERASAKKLFLTIANGNHDKVSEEAIEGYCHVYEGCNKNVDIVDVYKILEWEDCKFALVVMAYFPENGSFSDKLKELKDDLVNQYKYDLDHVILYIHEGIRGALGDFETPKEVPAEIFNDFHFVLAAHYHNRVELAGTDIMYIGSSRQNNFGEDEDKGYTILYDDGTTKFVKNEVNTRYATLETSIEDIDDDFMQKLADFHDCPPVPYKVRVRVKCTDAQAKVYDKKILLDAGASKVEFITDKSQAVVTQSTSIDEKYDKNGIKKEYQSFCNEKSIDSKLGMKYLDKLQ